MEGPAASLGTLPPDAARRRSVIPKPQSSRPHPQSQGLSLRSPRGATRTTLAPVQGSSQTQRQPATQLPDARDRGLVMEKHPGRRARGTTHEIPDTSRGMHPGRPAKCFISVNMAGTEPRLKLEHVGLRNGTVLQRQTYRQSLPQRPGHRLPSEDGRCAAVWLFPKPTWAFGMIFQFHLLGHIKAINTKPRVVRLGPWNSERRLAG